MTRRWAYLLEGSLLSLLAFLLAVLAWLVLAAVAGLPPGAVVVALVQGALGTPFAWEQTLRAATPLLLTGLCVALPARAGLLVVGGEGAVVLGGLAAAVAAVSVPLPLAPLALFGAASLVGALWLGLCGWLRVQRGVHEAVSGLLLTYVAIAILHQLVEGPLRDSASFDKPATAIIPAIAQVGTLGNSTLHWGLVVGLCACVAAHVFVAHTPLGFAVRVGGGNPRAAMLAGLPRARQIVGMCLLGGALAGLAGAFEVAAVHQRAHATLVLGYGYAGILVAAFARGNMLAIALAAFLVGALEAGGGMLQRRLGAPASSVELLQGLLFLSLVCCTCLQGRAARWWAQRWGGWRA